MIRKIITNYRTAFSGLPREIWFLSFIMLINRSGSMVLPFLSIYVSQKLGLGDAAAGGILASFGIGSCIGSFSGGYLAERIGPFRVQIISLIGNGVGFAVLSQMTSFWALAIVIFLTSTVADLFRPANGASITFLSPAALHKRAFALNRLAVNLGFTVGPLVGGMLAFYSYQWLFWVNAITCLLAAGLFQLLLGSHLTDHPESQNEKAMGIASGVIGTSPFADGKYLLFLLLNFITFCVFFQLISTYPLFLEKEFFLNEFEIGMLLGLNTIIVVLFEMVLIQSIDHCSALKTIAWGSLLMCLGFGVLPLGFGFGFTALTVLIWTLGEMLAMPQMFAYVSSISNRQNRSRYLGLYTLSVSLALVCGPWVGTRLYTLDHFQFWHWGTVIGCGVFSGFYAMAWHEQRTRRQRKLAAETV